MELVQRRTRESSIVLIGTFFPLLLVPQWFVRNGLLPEEDADSQIGIEVVIKELTKFSVSSISVEVTEDRVVFRSNDKAFDSLIRDLAVGVITLLPDSKITAVGLNVVEHLEFLDHKFWHYMGHALAPKEIWLDALGETKHVGLKVLTLQAAKPKGQIGSYNISFSWLNRPDWAQFSFNNHYSDGSDIQFDAEHKALAEKDYNPLDIVLRHWEQALDQNDHAISRLLDGLSRGYLNERSR